MATHIGDEGMVLPDAPKLMFDKAVQLGGGLSTNIAKLLKTSLNLADDADLNDIDIPRDQRELLREWQEVATKNRLIDKLNYKEWVDKGTPLNFLATIKAIRDALPPRPIVADAAHIESYPELIEAYNDWEAQQRTLLDEMVSAFSSKTPNGEMTEEQYVNMYLAFSAAYMFKNSRRRIPDSYRSADWESEAQLHAALVGSSEDSVRYYSVTEEFSEAAYKRITVDDISLAGRFYDEFFSSERSEALNQAAQKVRSTARSAGASSTAELRRAERVIGKLNDVVTELRGYATYNDTLHAGRIRSDRRGYKFKGVIELLSSAYLDDPGAELKVHRDYAGEAMLGIKMRSTVLDADANDVASDDVAEGTPLDADGKPLDQPKRPVRLDLSAEIASLEDSDVDLDDSEEAIYEDFRFLVDDYGFRGLQIGKYVPQKMRRYLTGAIHQSVNDLASVAKVPPTLIALGNPLPDELKTGGRVVGHQSYPGMSLGLALGARGKGKAAAHYESGGSEASSTKRHIINLTRDKGGGSLAHEFGHALDFTLAELCDLSHAMDRYNSKTIARMTGRPTGTGVATVSEAWSVYWGMASNRHVQKSEAMPSKEEVRRFASNMLRSEHKANPEYLEMILGVGEVMKQIYARELSPQELLQRHSVKFSETLVSGLRAIETVLSNFAADHYQESSPNMGLARLSSEGLWSHADGLSIDYIKEIAGHNSYDATPKIREMVETVSRKRIEEATGRMPHDKTVSKIASLVCEHYRLAINSARLIQLGIDNQQYWNSPEGNRVLDEKYKEVDDLEGSDGEGNRAAHVRILARVNRLVLLTSGYLNQPASEDERRFVREQVSRIALSATSLDYHADTVQQEFLTPTPHAMESSLSQAPSSIDVDALDDRCKARVFNSLNFLNFTSSATSYGNGMEALWNHLAASGTEIPDERLALHPRMMARISTDLSHRLNFTLSTFFQAERGIMEAVGIDPDAGDKLHPAIPSTQAREALESPEKIANAFVDAVGFHSDLPATHPEELVGILAVSKAIRERLPSVLEEPTPATQFAAFVIAAQDVHHTYVIPSYKTARSGGYNTPPAPLDSVVQDFITPYEAAFFECLEQKSQDEESWQPSPYNDQGGVEWRHRESSLRSLGSAFGQLKRCIEEESFHAASPEAEKMRSASAASMLVGRMVQRALHHGGSAYNREQLDLSEIDDTNAPERYMEGLKKLAAASDELGPAFAYMTPADRNTTLLEVFGENSAPTQASMHKLYEDGSLGFIEQGSMRERRNPPFVDWCRQHFTILSGSLHIKELSVDEKNILKALRNGYRSELDVRVDQFETSRFARASAAYDGRDLGRNAYLNGKSLKYWGTPIELFPRSFETFVNDQLKNEGRESRYLVTVADEDRQERQLDSLEALVVRDGVFGGWRLDLESIEDQMFKSYTTDYSLVFPAKKERLEMEKAFAPLMESLESGLAQRFPEAIKLHEHNLANGVYEHDQAKVERLRKGLSSDVDVAPAPSCKQEQEASPIDTADIALAIDQVSDEPAAEVEAEVEATVEPPIVPPAQTAEEYEPPSAPVQPALVEPASESDADLVDEVELNVPPALRQAMSDMPGNQTGEPSVGKSEAAASDQTPEEPEQDTKSTGPNARSKPLSFDF